MAKLTDSPSRPNRNSIRSSTPDDRDRVNVLEDLLQQHGIRLPEANASRPSMPPATSSKTGRATPPQMQPMPTPWTAPENAASSWSGDRQPVIAGPSAWTRGLDARDPPSSTVQWSALPATWPETQNASDHVSIDGTANAMAAEGQDRPAFDPPLAPVVERSPQEQSHGTLVISHSGRSKYLGPSAASEWLKDVSNPPLVAFCLPIDILIIFSKKQTSQANRQVGPGYLRQSGSIIRSRPPRL